MEARRGIDRAAAWRPSGRVGGWWSASGQIPVTPL